jgi:hypothetical protein
VFKETTAFLTQASKYKSNAFSIRKKGGQAISKGWFTTYHPVLPTVQEELFSSHICITKGQVNRPKTLCYLIVAN